jgi:predicted transcriptional regulator
MNKYPTITVRIDSELLTRLRAEATRREITTSRLVIEAIRKHLEHQ